MKTLRLSGYRVFNTHGVTERCDALVVEGGEDLWRLPEFGNTKVIFQEADDWPSENYVEGTRFKANIRAIGVITEDGGPIFVIDPSSVERLRQVGADIDEIPEG